MDGIRFAAARRLLVAITVCLALPVMSATLRAQDEGESVELKDPVAIAVDPDNGHAFIVQESKLVRWTEGGIDVLVEDLSATSIPLDSISRMTFRDRDRLTLLGERNGKPAFATWAIDLVEPPKVEAGLSPNLGLPESEAVTGMASTDLAIYLSSVASSVDATTGSVWRIGAGRATLGKPKKIFSTGDASATALAVSPQGHLLVAYRGADDKCVLRFHHAETGIQILQLPIDVTDITAMDYGKAGLLYATCRKGKTHGVFRLEARYRDGQQSVHAVELKQLPPDSPFACSDANDAIALFGGPDGKALRFKLR